jgi:hypothetical protein
MYPLDVLKGRRPLTKEEIAQIPAGVSRPAELDETLFASVLDNLLRKHSLEIMGTETDPEVRNALMELEVTEAERNARLQIRLTQDERRASNFPSSRDEHLPKYYPIDDIPAVIALWTKRLGDEILTIFDLKGEGAADPDLTLLLGRISSSLARPWSPKRLASLLQHLKNLRVRAAQLPELEAALRNRFVETPLAATQSQVEDFITETLTGEKPLSREQIEAIVSKLDYAKNYHGSSKNVTVNAAVNNAALEIAKKDLRRQLKKIRVTPRELPELEKRIVDQFERSLALPGKMVGNIMASSFGEASTQANLNTFHAAGNRDARKQITGFAKFEAMLEAVENPKSNTITIFMDERFTGEQLRLRTQKIQMTTMADLIESHRIISSANPMPRWEIVHDVVNGINYGITYEKRLDRFNLHRLNPIFRPHPENPALTRGRILEIKLSSRELFFRRISMSQVAQAIEEMSSDYRVVTSSIDIGLIYVYFKFESISTMKDVKGGGDTVPAFAYADQQNPGREFEFALNNLIYPEILSVQIGGIYGVEYAGVQSYKISKAIDFGASEMEKYTAERKVSIQFEVGQTIMWGLSPKVITEFILVKLERFTPQDYDIHLQYDEDTGVATFHTAGLRFYDFDKKVYRPFTMKDIQTELSADVGLRASEILRRTRLPRSPDQRTDPTGPSSGSASQKSPEELRELQEFQQRYIPRPVRMDGNEVLIEFDAPLLERLRIDLREVGTTLESIFGSHGPGVMATVSHPNASIHLAGILLRPDEAGQEQFQGDVSLYVEDQLKSVRVTSNRLQQSAVRWYYNAEGKNFVEVLAHPDVDARYTRTDNVVEVYRVLGPEACRSILIEEIASNTDAKINPVHTELLADAMLYRTPGDKPLAINHYGMTKRGAEFVGLLWETTTKVALRAGLGQVDNLRSFPAKIMMGLLDTAGKMTKEDRSEILKDRQVFGIDFPQDDPTETPTEPVIGEVQIVNASFIKEEVQPDTAIRLNRLRNPSVKRTPEPRPSRVPAKLPAAKQSFTSKGPALPSPSRILGGGPGAQFKSTGSTL